ncbi:MAG TPA: hypothetical protein EYQ10_06240, partial [Gammaproteobacteria bacterium]|nr:hypothetical protein [Gammaproteobacteria bacterium]
MKKTIVGALIIGGLIGGAILLSDQDKLHRINGTQDMVWVSDDLHMNVQDGNKRKIIKKIKKSKDGTQDMALFSDDVLMDVQDGNKHVVIKHIGKSKDGTQDMTLFSDDVLMDVQDGNKHVVIKHIGKSNDQEADHHASKKIFVIKMGSGEHDVEVDVKATLEKLKEEMDSVDWDEVAEAVAESIKELDIDVN